MSAMIAGKLLFFITAWVLWIPITFWFGRVFCRYICPLGWCQSIFRLIFRPRARVRRVCANLPRSIFQRIVNILFVAVYFLLPAGYLLNPWGIFGRAVFVAFTPGLVIFAAVIVSALIGNGRFWCNWVCPLGTIYDLFARLGWKHEKICKGCEKCRRCFG